MLLGGKNRNLYSVDFIGKSMWCPEQKMEKLMETEDPPVDPFCVELSENRGKQLRVTNAEERPIKAAIQEKKQTFEEFVEEQMRIEEQRLKQKQKLQDTYGSAVQRPVIKRPFLKRGEGLTRFTNAKSKIVKFGENTVKPPQRVSDDRNLRVDRSQMQKKSLISGKELVSGSPLTPCKKNNHPDKAKCPLQKTLVLRNHNGKNSLPLETRMQPGKNLDGQIKVSFSSEINNKIENKENVVEFTKPSTGSKIRNKLPDTEKPQFSCEMADAFSNSNCSVSHSVKDSELSFEVSFQNKLENWEKEKEKENLELDEFLFLEQAADEISFSSNSSFVQRILDQDQQISQGRRMSSTPIKAKQQQVKELAINLINKKKAECVAVGNKNDKAVNHTVSNSETASRLKVPLNKADSVMFSASSMTAVPALKSTEWIENEDKDEENGDSTTDSEQEFETTLKYENEDVKTSFVSHRESDPELLHYGSSATNISKESKNGSASLDSSDKDSSAQSKQKVGKASEHQRSMSCVNRNKFEFDDESTWSDLDENYVRDDLPEKYTEMPSQTDFFSKNDTPFPDKTLKRKVASKRGEELSKQSAVDSDSNGPPSNLMVKLFPSLKPKQKTDCHPEHEIKSNVEQESGGATVPSQILREKLIELEMEIERFRAENTVLTKLREEREHALASIR
ncbi:hypothetical protein CIB84_008531 [Bambusicola thoracicus]|uniref:CENPJ tubulin-binding region domain-containing protein n=1 Tax=Bambusicola thoracicus TaxID=9083 RepID=A0A2P4SUD9_BAMTH|nr:hypothetical protein CIB84_008531 [Bambusicola thoracicus]